VAADAAAGHQVHRPGERPLGGVHACTDVAGWAATTTHAYHTARYCR
jgi:hypothetical protein